MLDPIIILTTLHYLNANNEIINNYYCTYFISINKYLQICNYLLLFYFFKDLYNELHHNIANSLFAIFGGGERDRTDDPLLAKQVLSQLSYTPCLGGSGWT